VGAGRAKKLDGLSAQRGAATDAALAAIVADAAAAATAVALLLLCATAIAVEVAAASPPGASAAAGTADHRHWRTDQLLLVFVAASGACRTPRLGSWRAADSAGQPAATSTTSMHTSSSGAERGRRA
jgi:hypothetical protein